MAARVTELVSVCLHNDNDSILRYVFILVSGHVKRGGVVAVYRCFKQHSEFLYCRLDTSAGQLTVSPMSTIYCPKYDLVSFSGTDRGLSGVRISSEGDIVARRAGHAGHVGWEIVGTCDNDMLLLPKDLEALNEEDPRQVYLAVETDIQNSLAVYEANITGKLAQVQDLQEARGSFSSGELDIGAFHREGECTVFSSKRGVSIVTGRWVDNKLELAQRLLVLQQPALG